MLDGPNIGRFSWDSKKKFVVAEASVWEAYVQVHKNAAGWKNESFPHYEELCIILGKDQAIGKNTRTATDIVREMYREEQANVQYGGGCGAVGRDRLEDQVIEKNTQTAADVVGEMDCEEQANARYGGGGGCGEVGVFGLEDQAIGKNTKTIADVVGEMDREEKANVRYGGDGGRGGVGGDGLEYVIVNYYAMSPPTPGSSPTNEECSRQRSRKKRCRSQDPLVECISNAFILIANKIEDAATWFSRALGVEVDVMEKIGKLNAELAKRPGLSIMDRYKAGRLITEDQETTSIFFSLEEDDKEE